MAAALTGSATSKSGRPIDRLIGSVIALAMSKALRMPEASMCLIRSAIQASFIGRLRRPGEAALIGLDLNAPAGVVSRCQAGIGWRTLVVRRAGNFGGWLGPSRRGPGSSPPRGRGRSLRDPPPVASPGSGWAMHRIFLGLAITDGTLLVAALVLGFGAAGEVRGPGEVWHGLHFLMGLLATMTTLLVHSIVFTYFLGTGRWVKEVVRVYRLPDWLHAQALKNKRKAFPFEILSMALIGG